eukprot:c28128_g1_i2 orf=1-2175(+)
MGRVWIPKSFLVHLLLLSAPPPSPSNNPATLAHSCLHRLGSHALALRLFLKISSFASCADKDDRRFTRLDATYANQQLQNALHQRNTEEVWRSLQTLIKKNGIFPEPASLNNSFTLLSYGGDALSLNRAYKLLARVKAEQRLDLLDGDSLCLLALAFARANMPDFAANALRLLVREDFFPSLKVWTTILEHLMVQATGASLAAKLFLEICMYLKRSALIEQESTNTDSLLAMTPNQEAFNLALEACVTGGNSVKAEEIIDQMGNFDLAPDNSSFCSLIKTYVKDGRMRALKMILPRMTKAGVVPNQATLNTLLSAYVNLDDVDAAGQLLRRWLQAGQCGKVASDEPHDSKVRQETKSSATNTAISEGTKSKMVYAEQLLSTWGTILGTPDAEAYGTVLKGFVSKGRVLDAAQLLIDLQERESYEYVECQHAIDGLLQLGIREGAHGILHAMAALNAPADVHAYASLLQAYCQIPQPEKAEEVIKDAKMIGHQLAIACHEALIDMYLLLQDYSSAFSVFTGIKKCGLVPLEASFTLLLKVFETSKKPSLMRKVLEVACLNPPMQVELKHWNATVETFCKARMMFDAKCTVKRMKQLGFQPDATTYNALLNGYYTHGGKTNEILLLWPEVTQLNILREGIEPLKFTKDLLDGFLHAFVRFGYFKKALDVVSKMEEQKFYVDKTKYKKLYLQYHRDLFTSSHASQRRVDKSQERRKQVGEFKNWVGL